MARYIDAVSTRENFQDNLAYMGSEVKRVLNIAPTADVVQAVRCKDCEHYKPYAKPVEDFDGECIVRQCETDENEFCSYGKRKGGEQND